MFFSEDGISLRYLLLHPAVWFVVATVGLMFTAIRVWDRHQDKIIQHGGFSLTAEKFDINSPPPWLDTDLHRQLGQVFWSVPACLIWNWCRW